jgi:ribosomal protein L37AE/L43A
MPDDLAGAAVLTRADFDRRRAALKRVARRESRILAVFSVGLGLAQLLFIRWAEPQMAHAAVVAMAGSLFLAYILGVAALLWRMQRRIRAARLACPHCRAALSDMSERVASATGRCDLCGGQLIGPGDRS